MSERLNGKLPIDLSGIELERVVEIWVSRFSLAALRTLPADKRDRELYVWSIDNSVDTSEVVGPSTLFDVVRESDGAYWYMFWCADCFSPPMDLVRGDSFEDAYEYYIDWAAEHRGLKIEEPDLKDYDIDGDNPTCSFTSEGIPVDTNSVNGTEVYLYKLVLG
jgi:hypothetical protein